MNRTTVLFTDQRTYERFIPSLQYIKMLSIVVTIAAVLQISTLNPLIR